MKKKERYDKKWQEKEKKFTKLEKTAKQVLLDENTYINLRHGHL